MIATFTSILVSQRLSSQPVPDVPIENGSALIMLVAGFLLFLVAITVVKGVLGVMARLAEVAIAIGGTVMVVGLVGFGSVALYLLSVAGLGPLQ